LVPTPDSGNDFVGVCGPSEGFGVVVCIRDETVDCDLEIDDGSEHAALEAPSGELGEEAFARGLNDTPKIVGLLLIVRAISIVSIVALMVV
jgi:hypothetical protein